MPRYKIQKMTVSEAKSKNKEEEKQAQPKNPEDEYEKGSKMYNILRRKRLMKESLEW